MVEKGQGRLVIINDHQFLSDVLGELLKEQGFDLVGSFTDTESGLAYLLAHPPDLVIIDMMLPISRTRNGEYGDIHHPHILMDIQVTLRTVRQIRVQHAETRIIILNGERHPNTYLLGFEAGADGIASKLDGFGSFNGILKRVMAGDKWVISARMQKVLAEYGGILRPALSPLEVKVLELVQEGKESQEIGRRLGYSRKTIRNALSRINEKFGTSNRYEALGMALDMGLVGWRTGDEES